VTRALLKAAVLAREFRAERAMGARGGPRAELAAAVVEGKERPRIFSKVDANTGELYVYETIGFDCFAENGGLTANKVKDALAEMKGVKTLNVYINSEGGDVFEAKSIFSQLQRFDAEKVVHIDGLAASAATLVAMAGDRIVSSPVATWMIHDAWSGAMGNATDLRSMADVLDLESQTIADTYARQTGGTPEAMRELMLAETWMNAQQALDKGFTDEISADSDESEGEDDAEEDSSVSNSIRRPAFLAAAALTQARLKTVSPAQLMAARAQMHRRNHPGQPGEKREPASR
jgi:ATP-dependent Clp protease protease subunit